MHTQPTNYGVTSFVILSALLLSLSACGVKGKLKTPDQIEKLEAKEAREKEKKLQDAEEKKKKILEENAKDKAAESAEQE
ncbi:MAG: lipoprotein [Rickettsiales bacterium]